MKFKILLFILGQKMKRAAKNNDNFRNLISGKNLKIVMKTTDGRHGKAFLIQNGTIRTSSDFLTGTDAALIWSDGNTAFKVMSSGDDEAMIAAMTEKKLQSEGNYREFIWFLTALSKLSPRQG